MITAVDTNVLVDIFRSDSAHHSQSREWLRTAYDAGAIIICDIVYAELVPAFGGRATLDGALADQRHTLCNRHVNRLRGRGAPDAVSGHRRARERTIPGFIIGSHAVAVADTLLTRDRGFYATCFPELKKP